MVLAIMPPEKNCAAGWERRPVWNWGVIPLFCLLILICRPVFAGPPGWLQVRSPHFVIVTNGGEQGGRQVALRMEQAQAAFGQLTDRNLNVRLGVPVEVVAFRNRKELRQFARLWKGKPVELAGFFLRGEGRDFIALDLSAKNGWEPIFHEFSHLLVHANFTSVPLWFDEGLAEYFTSLEVEGDSLIVGNRLPGVTYLLKHNRWMPTEALFKVNYNSPEYNENGDHRSMFYAESWLVMHYFIDQQEMKEVASFLTFQGQKMPAGDAFQRAFGTTEGQFDKVLRQYFETGSVSVRHPAPQGPGLDAKSYTCKSLTDIEAAAILADLHVHEADYQNVAMKEFEQILAKQPENSIAHRGLGYAYLRNGDLQNAGQHFEKAIAADPTDPEAHYLYALMLAQAAKLVGQTERTDGKVRVGLLNQGASERTGLMKKELQASIGLNPENAAAYNLLALAQSAEGDLNGAISSAKRAYELSHRETYAMNLAYVYGRAQKWDEVEALLKVLSDSPEPLISGTARRELEELQAYRKDNEKKVDQ